jgi:hypothetical protein
LKRENPRDHLTNLELIFTMPGVEQTRHDVIESDAQGFPENKNATTKGGRAAGKALNAFAGETGRKVVTHRNFKQQIARSSTNNPG